MKVALADAGTTFFHDEVGGLRMQDKVISKIKVFGFALFAVLMTAGIFSVTTYAESLDTKLDTDGTIRVTVPTEIQCMMLSDGSVVVPTGFSIQNKEDTMSIMMEPLTVNDYGYPIDYTLDVGGTRVLTRTNQKDVAKPLSFEAGESKEMTLQVSQLTRAKHEKLMDAAAQGTTSMFRIQFSFKEKQAFAVYGFPMNITESHTDVIDMQLYEDVSEESVNITDDEIILEDEIILDENKEVDVHEETQEDVILLDPSVDVVLDTRNNGASIDGGINRSDDSESESNG